MNFDDNKPREREKLLTDSFSDMDALSSLSDLVEILFFPGDVPTAVEDIEPDIDAFPGDVLRTLEDIAA